MLHRYSLFSFLVFFLLVLPAFQGRDGKARAKPVAGKPVIGYGIKKLPPLVQKMYRAIYRAARSGDQEMMRTVLETNELLPLIGDKLVEKPVDFWMKQSRAGDGLSIFATMTKLLDAGYSVHTEKDGSVLYVWPYFAALDNKKLEDYQKVLLYRTVPETEALTTLKTGHYTSYSLGIGEDGTWHFFRKNKAP